MRLSFNSLNRVNLRAAPLIVSNLRDLQLAWAQLIDALVAEDDISKLSWWLTDGNLKRAWNISSLQFQPAPSLHRSRRRRLPKKTLPCQRPNCKNHLQFYFICFTSLHWCQANMPHICNCRICRRSRTYIFWFWLFILISVAQGDQGPFYLEIFTWPRKCRLFDGKFDFGRKADWFQSRPHFIFRCFHVYILATLSFRPLLSHIETLPLPILLIGTETELSWNGLRVVRWPFNLSSRPNRQRMFSGTYFG